MGILEMPLLEPVNRSVSSSISFRTWSKSTNFRPLQWRNSAHSAERLQSNWRIRGRRVTIPEPRGKKSLFYHQLYNALLLNPYIRTHIKIVSSLSDEVLEHTRLAGALTTDDSDLWQVDLNTRADLRKGVLQRVHQRYQPFHARISRRHFLLLFSIYLFLF